MTDSPTPALALPHLVRRMPLLVWLPIGAATLIIGHSLFHASRVEEVLVVGLGVGLLATGHALMRARARREGAEADAQHATAELRLRSQVGDCEERRKSLAAFAQLASHVAHEVRNPLSSIILNAELLEEEATKCGCDNADEARALVRSIQREAERLRRLTDEYLAFARPPRPSAGHHSLNAIVDDLAHQVREEALRGGVAVVTDLSRDCPCALIDPQQITQASWNLVRNALQAMPGGGRLALSTHVEPTGAVTLVVDDTGPGIPAELRCRVLEPFYTTKPDGSGLGLSLAAHIIRDHGGDLEFGDAPGGGARFTLRLPASRSESGACCCSSLAPSDQAGTAGCAL